MPDFISTLIGAGVVLAGIWLKARIEHALDRKTVAAVVYAELSEALRQLNYFAALIGIFSKYIDKERLRELRENEAALAELEGDPKTRRVLERAARQLKLMVELSKEFGPKSILHGDPMGLGKLGPHLAYLVRSLYARIDAATFPVAGHLATGDLQDVLDLMDSFDQFEREVKGITEMWGETRPHLLRAAGIQAR